MIFGKLRRKKKQEAPEIARSEFLEATPVRNPTLKWEKDKEANITLIIPLEQPKPTKRSGRRKGLITKLAPPPPKEKKIQLDAVGSIVWELCDGEKTMKGIVEALQEKYKMLPSEAEISLNAYFNQLAKRSLVGFVLPEETRARLEEAAKKGSQKK